MTHSTSTSNPLHEELITRVLELDGKECEIENNRQTLSATIDALSENTTVDYAVIKTIADQLSVQKRYIDTTDETTDQQSQLERNNRIAKYVAIVIVAVSIFSLFKWFNVSNNIKSIMHEVSPVQSRVADFRLRSGRYPYAFNDIGYADGPPTFDSITKLQMGPKGELLIETPGLFGTQALLVPSQTKHGQSKWACLTSSSWIFLITPWVCGYQSSLKFRNQ